jgi:hypothetical protein
LSRTGLSTTSGLMTTADGRTVVSYIAKCALPEGRTLVKSYNGRSYTFRGKIGLAPEWENGSCGGNCQEWVTACLLSMVNTTGEHVPIYMMAEHPAVGFGQSPFYKRQEGSFFGNLFSNDPQAFYCKGRDYSVSPVAGRIGSTQINPPYVNIYHHDPCSKRCTPADIPHAADGFKACSGWNRVVTIWRK